MRKTEKKLEKVKKGGVEKLLKFDFPKVDLVEDIFIMI